MQEPQLWEAKSSSLPWLLLLPEKQHLSSRKQSGGSNSIISVRQKTPAPLHHTLSSCCCATPLPGLGIALQSQLRVREVLGGYRRQLQQLSCSQHLPSRGAPTPSSASPNMSGASNTSLQHSETMLGSSPLNPKKAWKTWHGQTSRIQDRNNPAFWQNLLRLQRWRKPIQLGLGRTGLLNFENN